MSKIAVNEITNEAGTGAPSFNNGINATSLNGGQFGGRRNLIINGAMQVAQRGTSFTAAGGYSLDRWGWSFSGGNGTVTQESFALDSEVGGCKNYLKFAVTTGNNFAGIYQNIEDVQSIKGGETYTISFYAKGTNPGGGTTKVRMRQYFGSGGSANVETIDSITLTNSWQRFTITKIQNSLSGKTIGTGSYIQLFIHQDELDTSTDAWELNITGVQLEVGDTATPFEHRSYGEELALCQRYYSTNYLSSQTIGQSSAWDGASITIITDQNGDTASIFLPVQMRSSPSVTIYSPQTGVQGTYHYSGSTNPSADVLRQTPFNFNLQSSRTFTAERVLVMFEADAEL